MAKRIRHRSNWIATEDGAERVTLPIDTGNLTYTESFHTEFSITAATSYASGIGHLTEGNHLWLRVTTGTVYVCFESAEITRTNSVSLLSGGQLIVTKATFASLKFKNANAASTTTIEYWVAGD